MKKGSAWLGIAIGVSLILPGISSVLLDLNGFFRGVIIPAWVYSPILFLGIIIFAISLWGLFRKESKQEIDDYAAKGKAKMDQMYFNEYGVWPDYKDDPEQSGDKPEPSKQDKE